MESGESLILTQKNLGTSFAHVYVSSLKLGEEIRNMHDVLEQKAFDPLGGDKWFPKETWFEEDMPEYWGDWGCHSEVDELKAVLMRRPGKEVDDFDFREVRFRTQIDPVRFRAQHDQLAEFYRSKGVAVHYVEDQREDRPNALF